MTHISVLTTEVVDGLAIAPAATIVDATLGAAGHARAIADRLGPRGTIVGIDADLTAIEAAQSRLAGVLPTVHLINENFTELPNIVRSLHIKTVDGIVADLGWRSEQFADGGKGFSFNADEPLLMTYGDPNDYSFTAAEVVNEWAEEDLANVIFAYGEERAARRIARAITTARDQHEIETASELADIVRSASPRRAGAHRTDPATRTFQALRILVNDELSALETFLNAAWRTLAPGGRLAIISFHSLEDRIVKQTFRSFVASGHGTLITKRPSTPTDRERIENPRARSAKLRIIRHD